MKWLVKADSLVDDSVIKWEVDADSPEEAELKGYHLARTSKVADSGTVEVCVLKEDKEVILALLLELLQYTRAGGDIAGMEYDKDRETVDIYYTGGGRSIVNVEADSGIAMIRDVLRKIG